MHDFYRIATMPEPPLTPPDSYYEYQHIDGCEEDCGDQCVEWANEPDPDWIRDVELGR